MEQLSAMVTTGSTKLNNNLFAINLLAIHLFQSLGCVSNVIELHELLVLFRWRVSQFLYGTYKLKPKEGEKNKGKKSESGYTQKNRIETFQHHSKKFLT